jgi:hypothetical protein
MKSLLAAIVAVGLFAGPAYAVCSYPKAPDKIPDGNTATLEEMLAAKASVDAYNKEIESYLSCLNLEYQSQLSAEGGKLTDAQKKDLEKRQTQKHNAAVDEDEQLVDSTNSRRFRCLLSNLLLLRSLDNPVRSALLQRSLVRTSHTLLRGFDSGRALQRVRLYARAPASVSDRGWRENHEIHCTRCDAVHSRRTHRATRKPNNTSPDNSSPRGGDTG